MIFRTLHIAGIALLALGAASAASAAGVSVDISSGVNSNLYTFTGGASYPPAGSTVTISGTSGAIDFMLARFYANDPNAPDVGVVLTGDGSPTTATIDIADILLTGPTTFYTLINSGFGVIGQTIGDLTLNFASGPSYAYSLTEGTNVRDHYNGIFNNVATAVYGTANYTGPAGIDRLDAQQIVLPSSFSGRTVTSITLNNTNTSGGNPFLTALTYVTTATSAVPEPSTWAMMIGGLGLVGGSLRARRRRTAFA